MNVKDLAPPAEETSLERVREIRAHPAFRAAMRHSLERSIAVHRGGTLLGWLLGDRARAIFGNMVTYLDATYDPADRRSGLTATRIKELAAELGLSSPNRAAAMLALMQVSGFVAHAPGPSDMRVRRLVPTEKLRAVQRERAAGQLEALAMMEPKARQALAQLGDPEFERGLALQFAGFFLSGFRLLKHAPELTLFADRSTGMVLLYHMLLQGWDAPEQPIDLSIADLSRRYGVSRAHIIRLLREAEEAGLMTRNGNSLTTTETCRDAAANFNATMMLLFKGVVDRLVTP